MDDKIIVSHRGALARKYGAAGTAKIRAAVATLVSADAKRGIRSRLVLLDDASAMRRLGAPLVSDSSSPRDNKAAVDAIFRTASPDYLMILGAHDVVPHQDLANPMFDPPDDPDRTAFGDLPYACDTAYSRSVATFKGPTRVVGRLPDLTGAKEPSYLLGLLATAAKHTSRKPEAYEDYFGLSTDEWRRSTTESVFNVFGNAGSLELSPPSGERHAADRLARLAHFVNCHGGQADPRFYGQRGRSYPTSLSSDAIAGKIREGTIAAVECCYGAELYDSVTLSLPLPICQQYLRQGAYGYFGSTTIAYGPSTGNGTADLITQYFLLAVLDGASLGRAALTARQRFVDQTAELDPADLKTLAQFNLLGDPSIHPVRTTSPTHTPKGVDAADLRRQERSGRRAKLRAVGELLQATKPTASRKAKTARKSPTVSQALSNIAREAGFGGKKDFTAYRVDTPRAARARGRKAAPTASRYYVAVYRPRSRTNETSRSVAAVAKEVRGRIVGYRIYTEK